MHNFENAGVSSRKWYHVSFRLSLIATSRRKDSTYKHNILNSSSCSGLCGPKYERIIPQAPYIAQAHYFSFSARKTVLSSFHESPYLACISPGSCENAFRSALVAIVTRWVLLWVFVAVGSLNLRGYNDSRLLSLDDRPVIQLAYGIWVE